MKLPEQAKKVFDGVIFDVYQWEQEQFDGSMATYEMLKRADTVQVILVDEEFVYLSEEEQPSKGAFLSFFGGRQEAGETAEEGAKRELLEETGFEAREWRLYRTYQPYTKIDWNVHLFIARGISKVTEPSLDPGERITVKKHNFDSFLDAVLTDQFWGREFALDVARMRLDLPKLEEFKTELFEPWK